MQQIPWLFLVFSLLLSIIDVSFQRAKADTLHLVIYYSQEHQFENHQMNEKQVPPSQHLLDAIFNDTSGDTGSSTLLHDRPPFSRQAHLPSPVISHRNTAELKVMN